MRKTSWFAVAASLALAGCLGGCSNGRDEASASTASVPATSKNLVIVTWRPADKTAEFLSAWRAKE